MESREQKAESSDGQGSGGRIQGSGITEARGGELKVEVGGTDVPPAPRSSSFMHEILSTLTHDCSRGDTTSADMGQHARCARAIRARAKRYRAGGPTSSFGDTYVRDGSALRAARSRHSEALLQREERYARRGGQSAGCASRQPASSARKDRNPQRFHDHGEPLVLVERAHRDRQRITLPPTPGNDPRWP